MIDKLMIEGKPQAGFKTLFSWAWSISQGVRWRIFLVCLLGIVRVGISLTFVWVSKMIIDAATSPSTPVSRIWWLAAILAGCMLLELALSQVKNYIHMITNQRMTNGLRRKIYDHLLHSDLYTDRRHSGDILNRITVDVGSVTGMVLNTIPDIVVTVVQLVGAFWLLFVMKPMLALCALLITPICIIASKMYMSKMRHISREIRDGEGKIHTNIQEGLQHRVVVQTLECAPVMTNRLEGLQNNVIDKVVRREKISIFSRSTVRIGFITGYLIAFIWSVFGIHSGAITYGIMTAFLQLVGRIQGPISSLSGTIPSFVNTATAIDRLMEIYPEDSKQRTANSEQGIANSEQGTADSEQGIAGSKQRTANSEQGIANSEQGIADSKQQTANSEQGVGIKVSDITFAYPGTEQNVFKGFSHDFAPGSKTVIMGETGVGKSTLTKLILALLHPQSGSIEAYSQSGSEPVGIDTRRYMTYVPQGNSLLHGTIRDNLLLGKADATDEQMRQALGIAVANFVYDLPDGLDTECGELGNSLSEGQCQRIAIARALLRDCPVLILDEFNSSLDQATAETLLHRLMTARPNATIIFISHRPEVGAYCDSVLHLDKTAVY